MDQRRRIHDAYDEIAADYDDQRTAPTQGLLDGLLRRLVGDGRPNGMVVSRHRDDACDAG